MSQQEENGETMGLLGLTRHTAVGAGTVVSPSSLDNAGAEARAAATATLAIGSGSGAAANVAGTLTGGGGGDFSTTYAAALAEFLPRWAAEAAGETLDGQLAVVEQLWSELSVDMAGAGSGASASTSTNASGNVTGVGGGVSWTGVVGQQQQQQEQREQQQETTLDGQLAAVQQLLSTLSMDGEDGPHDQEVLVQQIGAALRRLAGYTRVHCQKIRKCIVYLKATVTTLTARTNSVFQQLEVAQRAALSLGVEDDRLDRNVGIGSVRAKIEETYLKTLESLNLLLDSGHTRNATRAANLATIVAAELAALPQRSSGGGVPSLFGQLREVVSIMEDFTQLRRAEAGYMLELIKLVKQYKQWPEFERPMRERISEGLRQLQAMERMTRGVRPSFIIGGQELRHQRHHFREMKVALYQCQLLLEWDAQERDAPTQSRLLDGAGNEDESKEEIQDEVDRSHRGQPLYLDQQASRNRVRRRAGQTGGVPHLLAPGEVLPQIRRTGYGHGNATGCIMETFLSVIVLVHVVKAMFLHDADPSDIGRRLVLLQGFVKVSFHFFLLAFSCVDVVLGATDAAESSLAKFLSVLGLRDSSVYGEPFEFWAIVDITELSMYPFAGGPRNVFFAVVACGLGWLLDGLGSKGGLGIVVYIASTAPASILLTPVHGISTSVRGMKFMKFLDLMILTNVCRGLVIVGIPSGSCWSLAITHAMRVIVHGLRCNRQESADEAGEGARLAMEEV